jgi:hypothetical protein
VEGQKRVRMALIWKGKNQNWLQEQTNIPHSILSQILNGRTVANEREKTAIANALHMPPDRLFSTISEHEISGFFFGNEKAEELHRARRTASREDSE